MKLYLVRHAAAVEADEWTNGDDTRPLTPDGKAQARLVADTLAMLHIEPDVLLTSPLVRTRETAEIIADRLHLKSRLREEERLAPGFHLPLLADLLTDYPTVKALLLVGHEPDFSRVIGELTSGRVTVKKGGLALVEIPEPTILSGELVWLAPPKLLGK